VFNLTASQILGLTVIAAIVTTVGNLLATWLKEFLFIRSFEKWKDRRTLFTAYRRYQDAMFRAAWDLKGRVDDICKSYPPNYLGSSLLDQRPSRLEANSAEDPYFKRYRLVSTVYRLCAVLGWLELYRQQVTLLDVLQEKDSKHLEYVLENIKSDLADGHPSTLNSAQGLAIDLRALGEADDKS
jgi:hypothetical protein